MGCQDPVSELGLAAAWWPHGPSKVGAC